MLIIRRGAGAGGAQAATTLLLDSITTQPTAAWSTRKLTAAYAGNALTVRRSSDDATQAIGFVTNELDTSSLASFVGVNDGLVTTWNDQSGAGVNAAQATAVNQPSIVKAGTLASINSKAVIAWKNTLGVNASTELTNAAAISSIVSASSWTVLAIMKYGAFGTTANRADVNGALIADASGFWFPLGSGPEGGGSVEGGHYQGANKQANIAASTSTVYVIVYKYDGVNVTGYVNGGAATQTAAGNIDATFGTISLGRGHPAAVYFDGLSGELLVYNAALSSADINTLAANMASRAGVTWSAVP